jgi:6-pyruvoyltetrahydropterin/6-carboxytetrahydropterin synthase
MSKFQSTKVIELGSCAFRQWRAEHSHCKFVHGYQLKAKLWFGGEELDEKNWIVDFGGLKKLKEAFKYQFDHTTCVAGDDPELDLFKEMERRGVIQLRIMPNGVGIERTAEFVFNIADEHVKQITNGRCWCERAEVFEHEDNSAIFEKQREQTVDVITESDKEAVTLDETFISPSNVQPPSRPNRAAPLYCKTDRSLAQILAG